MNTDQLIAALAADHGAPSRPMPRSIGVALAVGMLLSAIGLLTTLGLRHDLLAALASWRLPLKFAIVAAALVIAIIDCLRLARPTGTTSRLGLLVPFLLLLAVGVELATIPASLWTQRLVGTNSLVCLTAIPALSLAPLAAGLAAMKTGAPASPAAAGAAVGRLAAAAAALLYAFHCFDDSPLFVATWYTLATIPVIAVGGFLGSRVLRW